MSQPPCSDGFLSINMLADEMISLIRLVRKIGGKKVIRKQEKNRSQENANQEPQLYESQNTVFSLTDCNAKLPSQAIIPLRSILHLCRSHTGPFVQYMNSYSRKAIVMPSKGSVLSHSSEIIRRFSETVLY